MKLIVDGGEETAEIIAFERPPASARVGVQSVQVAVDGAVDGAVDLDEILSAEMIVGFVSPALVARFGVPRDDCVRLEGVTTSLDDPDGSPFVTAPDSLSVVETAALRIPRDYRPKRRR